MKKIILLLFAICLFESQAAQTINVKANIEEAKVYLRGAELTHKAKINLDKGTTEIVVSGISEFLDPMSVQAGFDNLDISILSITSDRNYLDENVIQEKASVLKDSIENLEDKISELNLEQESLNEELNLILSNKQMSGKDKGITAKELKEMADYYAERIPKLKKKIFELNKQKKKYSELIKKIQNQLQNNNEINDYKFQYLITVKTDKKTNAELFFRYFTGNASWTPFYDIRAKSNSNSINISAKGFVSQNTDIDWKDIKLTLSTKKIKSNIIPVNDRLTIDYAKAFSNYEMESNTAMMDKKELSTIVTSKTPQNSSGMGWKVRGGRSDDSSFRLDGVSISDPLNLDFSSSYMKFSTSIETEFTADDLYTIPSDNKEYSVYLTSMNLESTKEYYCLPKKSLSAYRIAKIKNNADLKLLNASANIYFDGTYLGKTFINTDNVKEDIKISLGTDETIIVDRDLLKQFEEEKFLSSDVERTYAFKNIIRNNKKEELKITVEDLIPVSQNEDIKVKVVEVSDAEFDEANGLAKWQLVIQPGQSAEVKTIYKVRYPANKHVIVK